MDDILNRMQTVAQCGQDRAYLLFIVEAATTTPDHLDQRWIRDQPRLLSSVRRSLSHEGLQTLVVSLVLTRLFYDNATFAGIPAILVYIGCWFTLASGKFKFTMPSFLSFLSSAASYLSAIIHRFSDLPSCRRVRSAFTVALIVRLTRLVPVGDSDFPVAATKLWNKLSGDVTASQSLIALRFVASLNLFYFGRS